MVGTANTNWQYEVYQTAFTTDNNISLTGGIKRFPYRLSIRLFKSGRCFKDRYLQSIALLAFVLNPTFLDGHLKVDLNLKGSMQKYHFADQGAIGTAVYFDPTQPVYTNSKRYSGYFEWLDANGKPNTLVARNPLAML